MEEYERSSIIHDGSTILLVFAGKSAACDGIDNFHQANGNWAASIANLRLHLGLTERGDFPPHVSLIDAFPSVEDWGALNLPDSTPEAYNNFHRNYVPVAAPWLNEKINQLPNLRHVFFFGNEAGVVGAHFFRIANVRGRNYVDQDIKATEFSTNHNYRARLTDQGYQPEDFPFTVYFFVHPSPVANAEEQRQQQYPILRNLLQPAEEPAPEPAQEPAQPAPEPAQEPAQPAPEPVQPV
eukprot:CAMPEP_0201506250 /NCGR_PEP_ID=MMETSP0161_2-20130828/190_1 /ASSEMBLY_ACC=CAM_ASM_000251 /TAXON_ID=180227 /ORGANISM="Neoparamoeba aestuarina, Strain SoJaBio B1-5/56/2" /LENGTH=238 /DNA_ID=CAMNT_0047900289 /DNA_START=58 /DNA_END=771 /DNA_ORIENTATION=-